MNKFNQRIISIAMAMLITLAGVGSIYALRAPHNVTNAISCSSCHKSNAKIRGIRPMCVSECHNSNIGAKAKKKALEDKFGSNIFGTFTNAAGARPYSHAWGVQPNYSAAGENNRKAGANKAITLNQPNLKAVSGTTNIICSKCHYAHGASDSEIMGSGGTKNKPFVRVSTKGNFICFQCHDERRVSNVRDPLPADKAYSHPVEVHYSSIAASKSSSFESSPTNVYGIESARLPLYTTYANQKGAVICSTCHGPMHSADSNPYTLDNLSSFSAGNYSATSADGRLLRRYGKAKDVTNELCKACHKVIAHQGFSCYRCHAPHKRQGENNRYLILQNISTPSNGIRPVVFESRSTMAARYGGYSTPFSRLDKVNRPVSNRICQVCHTNNSGAGKKLAHHRNYSSPSGAVDRTHNMIANGKYQFCPQCHTHISGFLPTGCGGCHNFPPADVINTTDSFRHGKHTNTDVEGAGSSLTFWATGTVTDNRSDSSYGFSCGRCHSPWGPYTATASNFQGVNHFGTSPASQKVYTADVGFRIKTSINSLPWNAQGTYLYATGGGIDNGNVGGSYWWRGAGAAAQCRNLYCHGQWYNGYTSNNPTATGTQACGKCHGASKTDPPGKTNGVNYGAHPRHVGSANSQQYGSATTPNFRCNACHSLTAKYNNETTVSSRRYHVNGRVNIKFDNGTSSNFMVGDSNSNYGGYNNFSSRRPAMSVRPAYKTCGYIYCHSDGSRTQANFSTPFNAGQGSGTAKFPNWSASSSGNFTGTQAISGKTFKRRCSRCHGNSTYGGITAAMPGYTSLRSGPGGKGNSHKTHIKNGFLCNVCHSLTVNADNKSIADTTKHVNKTYDIKILRAYSGVYDSNNKTCSMVSCHGRNTTPKWGNTAVCQNCHLSNSSDTDNFSFESFSGVAAQIYSTEWTKRGHGKETASGAYPNSPNNGAGKVCTNCHKPSVSHGAGNNYFRLMTSNPDRLCLNCHGSGTDLGSWGMMAIISNVTGIQSHTWANISTAGYNGGQIKAASRGGWNFGDHDSADKKKVKCVDCHDPHGDKNNYMLHTYINMSGSDRFGRPKPYAATAMMTFTAVGTPKQLRWSSYVKSSFDGICQRCHSNMMSGTTSIMDNFSKGKFSQHNVGKRCTDCHKHKQGFKPSGCAGCHGYPPPDGPTAPNSWNERASIYTTVGLHTPHAQNPRGRPGIIGENDVTPGAGFKCNRCHDNTSNGSSPTMGDAGNTNAIMKQLTSVYGDWSPGAKPGYQSVTDDTCKNIKCHTPRYYERTWKKPADCDDCHGYRNKANLEAFNIQTTGSHKIHVSYSTPGIAGTDKKKYGLGCSNCHYNWQALNNYSTHYSSYVNITANGPINTKGGAFYGTWGRTFKGFTTGNERTNANTTCSKVYCHGNFTNGTTTNAPIWKKGAMSTTCGSCHKAKTAKVAGWQDGSLMPERHPKHAGTAQYNFVCARCHVKTVTNNTTVQFAYSTHVNGRKDIYFNIATTVDSGRKFIVNNTGATFTSGNRSCKYAYCHSRGTDRIAPFNTRTAFSNFTARWSDPLASLGYKKPKGEKAKCNYCHGNKAYSGITAAMPNYSGTIGIGVTAKANSHRIHVVGNGILCTTCHNSIAMNNTSISDRTRHVNGFYNISIAPNKRGATGQKVYSMVYNGTGGTCMNNACHGTSKPTWGNPSTASCQLCHFSATNKDTDNYAKVDGKKAEIYSTEWKGNGHGKNVNMTCAKCHNSGVPHNYAQGANPSNPFRLVTSQPDALCSNCHGVASDRDKPTWPAAVTSHIYTGMLTHSRANAGNGTVASWNTHSSITGRGAKCVDCHDPHGDKNKKMIHAYINHSGSDRFGRPGGRPWTTFTSNVNAQMTFTSHGGQLIWSSFVNNNVNRSICRRCHTTGDAGLAVNMTKGNYATTHQDHTEKCTAKCHSHKTGFKPTGESSGGQNCIGCHDQKGAADVVQRMRATDNYHHVMLNTSAQYPNISSFGPSAQTSTSRRCLMCHVDHNVFRPDINSDGTGGRARNLRWSVLAQNNKTGINTDFWPAKRRNAKGRTGNDVGTGNYSSTRPISGPSMYNGVCISCHKNVQYKNTTQANDAIKTSRARNFPVNLYTSSSHNFQVISGTFAFGTGANKSSFRGNCTKCHRTPDSDFSKLSKSSAQSGRYPVALHDKNVPSLLMGIATSSSKPKIERLCFNCHDSASRASGGPGSMDFYSSIRMSTGAKMIKTAVVGKKYVKPIETEVMAGRHKIDEFYNVTGTVAEGQYPPAAKFWNFSTTRHIECVDCHNTHGGNASIRRTPGAPFRGDLRDGKGLFNHTSNTGNKISGAQKGVWGVGISYTINGANRGKTPRFSKKAQVDYQYEVCLKCHSAFAYGTNPRGVPSGLPFQNATTLAPYDSLGTNVPQADISRMINPNNYGYHPIFKKGRNQPPDNANPNWPAAKSNWMYKDRFTNRTAFISVSGFSWNFVPPFSQHSLLACTDCHTSDNSGNALAKFIPSGAPTNTGTWTVTPTLANLIKAEDNTFAESGLDCGSACTSTVPVTMSENNPFYPPTDTIIVAYGWSTSTSSGRRAHTGEIIKGTTMGSATLQFGMSLGRAEGYTGYIGAGWNDLKAGHSAKITLDAGAGITYIDYLGFEAVYQVTGEVRGPHGSMERWLLTDVDRDIWFDADNNNALAYNNTDRPNATVPTTGADGTIVMGGNQIFCWNCHRRDIYHYDATDATVTNYSRIGHAAAAGLGMENKAWDASSTNQWGIVCMNCHAGNGIGEIHGSFANSTTNWVGTPRSTLSRPRGVRLLNGAVFNGSPTGTGVSCYTIAGPTPYGGSCTQGHSATVSPQSVGTNYSYTSW